LYSDKQAPAVAQEVVAEPAALNLPIMGLFAMGAMGMVAGVVGMRYNRRRGSNTRTVTAMALAEELTLEEGSSGEEGPLL